MDWESYRVAVEAVWARHSPRTSSVLLVPWAGRRAARMIVASLTAVIADLERLDPPDGDADAVEAHYLGALRVTCAGLEQAAQCVPRRTPLYPALASMEDATPLFPDDADHNWVIDHGLPPWWPPRTEAWERRA